MVNSSLPTKKHKYFFCCGTVLLESFERLIMLMVHLMPILQLVCFQNYFSGEVLKTKKRKKYVRRTEMLNGLTLADFMRHFTSVANLTLTCDR